MKISRLPLAVLSLMPKPHWGVLIWALIYLMLTGCDRSLYMSQDFRRLSRTHEQVAILPYKVHYLDLRPDSFPLEEDVRIQQMEAYQLQMGLYRDMLALAPKMRRMRVSLMDPRIVIQKLEAAGLDPYDTDNVPLAKLTEILGVDALVLGEITKFRERIHMNRFRSTGNDRRVLRQVALFLAPTPNFEAEVSVSVIDGNGETLFSNYERVFGGWMMPVIDAVRLSNPRLIRRMPYLR